MFLSPLLLFLPDAPFCQPTTNGFVFPTCWLRAACGSSAAALGICSPTSLLADACRDEVLVREEKVACSRVPAKEAVVLRTLPNTKTAARYVVQLCEEMPKMKACACFTSGDGCVNPMDTLVKLCKDMPGMKDCSIVHAMCSELSTIPTSASTLAVQRAIGICGTSSDNQLPPPMRMFVHWDVKDYVLLETWLPRTCSEFSVACMLTFCFVVGLQIVKVAKNEREDALLSTSTDTTTWFPSSKRIWKTNIERALWTVCVAFGDLTVMLIAMTFNGYLISSILLGILVSTVLFGHRIQQQHARKSNDAVSCGC